MKEDKIKQFAYIEFANGGVINRGKMVKHNEWTLPDPPVECHHSLFRYDERAAKYVRSKKSLSGMPDYPCWPPYLLFDIDNKDNLNAAMEDTKSLVNRLMEQYEVDETAIHIWFSGNKGFHVGINSQIIPILPDQRMPKIYLGFAKALAEDIKIDTAIYRNHHLIRVENSINSKSRLYKIPLTIKELKSLDIEQIQELAKNPRSIGAEDASEITINTKLGILYQGIVAPVIPEKVENQQPEPPTQQESPSRPILDTTYPPCIERILKGVREGSRNETALRLASYLRSTKQSKEDVLMEMAVWNAKNFPSLLKNEIASVVGSAFKQQYRWNCKTDDIFQNYCDKKCSKNLFDFNSTKTIRDEINQIRGGPNSPKKQFQVHQAVGERIIQDMEELGKFYYSEPYAYWFRTSDKKLLRLATGDTEYELFMARYGLISTETIFPYVLKCLSQHSWVNGTKTDVYDLAHYDQTHDILYVFNQDTSVSRITPDKIELVDNGTDGVLFLAVSGAPAVNETKTKTKTENNGSAFNDILLSPINFSSSLLSPNQMRAILLIWTLGLYFREIMPTKPILVIYGDAGSGKSMTLRMLGKLVVPSNFDLIAQGFDSKDFDAAITNYPLAAFDNVDGHIGWLNDKLACAATGGNITRRVLYTTNETASFPIRSYVALTSRSPKFTRPDVSERLIVLRTERIGEKLPENHFLQKLETNRSVMFDELLQYLQITVRALKKYKNETITTNFRMADFAEFAIKIARYSGVENEMLQVFQLLESEQSRFCFERDPLPDLIDNWLDNTKNEGRWVKAKILYEELSSIAATNEMKLSLTTSHLAFSKKLSKMVPALKEYFDVTEKKISGTNQYRFRRKGT